MPQSIESVGESIGDGLALLAGALESWNAPNMNPARSFNYDYHPQHYATPSRNYHPHTQFLSTPSPQGSYHGSEESSSTGSNKIYENL